MSATEIWIDFNDIDAGGRTTTLAKWARGPLAVGRRVTCSDGDGMSQQAIVTNLDGDVVHLVMMSSFDCLADCGQCFKCRKYGPCHHGGDA